MTIIGDKSKRTKPVVYLKGPDRLFELTGFNASLPIGNIPVARCGVLPDDLDDFPTDADDQTYDVLVDDGSGAESLLFRGYVCGPSGRQTTRSIASGVDLIHVARDLDQMRLSAPSLHPQSVNDWSYERQGQYRTAGQSDFILASTMFYRSDSQDSLPKQVVSNLAAYLQKTSLVVNRANSAYPTYDFKQAGFQPAINLLNVVEFKGGGVIRGTLASALSNNVSDSINGHLCNILNDSLVSQRSIWDALSAAFSDFGMLLLCDGQGGTSVVPDLSNFKPPDSNLLDGSYILTRDQASTFYRRIGEVVLISSGVHPSPQANGLGKLAQATVASWPPPGQAGSSAATGTSANGATLSLLFPGWLSPINYVIDRTAFKREPASPSNPNPKQNAPADTGSQRQAVAAAQTAYAQMLYNQEVDKKRTFSLTGPLAPFATPGTTARIQPYSNLQARTTGRDVSGYDREYWAYCYEVCHNVEGGNASNLSTTFKFRNLSESDEGLGLTSHPIFSDAQPWSWQ